MRAASGERYISPSGTSRSFRRIQIGRVEVWRGGLGSAYLFPALSFAGASLASTMLPFPHPAHRTGRADFPLPALGERVTRSPTGSCASAW